MTELPASRPGVAKHRWLENRKSLLLSLPMELRLMIIEEALKDQVQSCCGRLHFSNGGWRPPSVLQTCNQLRVEGLPSFVKMEGSFNIYDFDSIDLLARDKWMYKMSHFYSIDLVGLAIGSGDLYIAAPPNSITAKQNLWVWLEDFFLSGSQGVVMVADECTEMLERVKSWYPITQPFDANAPDCKLAKMFLSVETMRRDGAEWEGIRNALTPLLELLVV